MFTNAQSKRHNFDVETLTNHFHAISPDSREVFPQRRPYVSSSLCPRAIMLNGTMPKREVVVGKALNYYGAIGNAIETQILEVYAKSDNLVLEGWKLPPELFPDGVDLGGKIDAILNINDTLIHVDIKTVGVLSKAAYINLSPQELYALQKNEEICIVPDDDRIKQTVVKKMKQVYESQVQLYAAITGLDDAYIMMVSRRIQEDFTHDGKITAEYVAIPITDDIMTKRIAVLMFGIVARNMRQVPDMLKDIKKGDCKDSFCDFYDFCWKDEPLGFGASFPEMSAEDKSRLKKECFFKAQEYIADRPKRTAMIGQLIKDEVIRREHIGGLLTPLHEQAKEIVKDYGLYPWNVSLGIEW